MKTPEEFASDITDAVIESQLIPNVDMDIVVQNIAAHIKQDREQVRNECAKMMQAEIYRCPENQSALENIQERMLNTER